MACDSKGAVRVTMPCVSDWPLLCTESRIRFAIGSDSSQVTENLCCLMFLVTFKLRIAFNLMVHFNLTTACRWGMNKHPL
eukprot:6470226-Amphidinium_carterae.1